VNESSRINAEARLCGHRHRGTAVSDPVAPREYSISGGIWCGVDLDPNWLGGTYVIPDDTGPVQ
jgi:hypothetical protein